MPAETHAESDGPPLREESQAAHGFRFARRFAPSRPAALHAASPMSAPAAAAAIAAAAQVSPTARAMTQLTAQCTDRVALMHHRRTPRIGSTIDHLAVAPSGVWLITSQGHGGRITARRPMFGDPRLLIGNHDRSDLLLELDRQVSFVERSLALEHPDIAVRSAICFVDTEAPLVGTPHLGSYLFFGTPAVVGHLNSDGPLRPERVRAVAELLELRFPAA